MGSITTPVTGCSCCLMCGPCTMPDDQDTEDLPSTAFADAGPNIFGLGGGSTHCTQMQLFSGGDGYVGGVYEPGCYRVVCTAGEWHDSLTEYTYNCNVTYNGVTAYMGLGFPGAFTSVAAVDAYKAADPANVIGPVFTHAGGSIGIFTDADNLASGSATYKLQKCEDG